MIKTQDSAVETQTSVNGCSLMTWGERQPYEIGARLILMTVKEEMT